MLKAKIKIKNFGFARHYKSIENIDVPYFIFADKLNNYYLEYGFTYYDKKVDIWNLGLMCYEMLRGKFLTFTNKVYYYLPITISLELVYFVNGMLQKKIKDRKSIEDLYNDEFLQKPFKELTKFKPEDEYQKSFCFDVSNLFLYDFCPPVPHLEIRWLKKYGIKRPTNKNTINSDSKKYGDKIKELQKTIIELEKKLKEEKIRVKYLLDNINELKYELNKKINEINNLNELIQQLNNKTKNENKYLNKKSNEENVISEQELQLFKEKIYHYPLELFNEDKILISVIFTTFDEKINYSIICKNTDIFRDLEEKFYKRFPEYLASTNNFYVKGVLIDKFKSIYDNNIHESDIINLNRIEI